MTEYLSMGGHAWYVWGSYGVALLFMVIEVIVVVRNKNATKQRLARMIRMNQQSGTR